MDLGLHGSVAAITGAGAGIGRASALALAAEGCHVAVAGRTAAPLEKTAQDARDLGVEAVAVTADLSTTTGADTLVERALSQFGRLDAMVCCVGSTPLGHFAGVSDDDWRVAFEGKFLATSRAVRAALPSLASGGGGAVVMVAGNASRAVPPGMVTSAVVNVGLERLASALARDNGALGVSVNCVSPGPTATARYDSLLSALSEGGTGREEAERGLLAGIPDGRPATAEEVAAVVTFLSAPVSRHVSGSTVVIDGGET